MVRRMDSPFLRCYAISHTWDDYQDRNWHPSAETLIDRPVALRCSSCGTIRHDIWARNSGSLVGRSYVYPGGYQVGKQEWGERTRKETFRAEYLERII